MANISGSADSASAGASKAWPVFRSLQAYRLQFFTHDLFAGLTLAAIAIPEQMATARLGGFTPADRLFRLSGGLAGVRRVRQQSLPVLRRGFDHHADLCRRACGSGRVRLAGISGAGGGAGADGRASAARRRHVPAGLDRGSALDTGDDQAFSPASPCTSSFRNCRASSDCPRRMARCCNGSRSSPAISTETNLFTLVIGLGVLAIITVSERIDARIPGALIGLAAGERGRGACSGSTAAASVFSARSPPRCRRLAIPEIALARAAQAWCSLEPHHRGRRHGADGGNDAILSVRSRRAAGCRPRLRRRRRRQHAVGADRRVSGQCQPAAHGGGFRDRRTIAARQPRRGGDRDCIAGVRRLAARPDSERRARRRPAVRRPADHPLRPDRRDLPAVARRIPADHRDRGGDHRAADRAGRRHRHRALAAARHLEHDARPRADLRTGARNLDLVAVEPKSPGRTGARRHRRGISGAAVVSQRLSFPARHPGRPAVRRRRRRG